MRGLDREGGCPTLFDTSYSNRETREGEVVPRRARHRRRLFQASEAPAGTNKDKHYVLQIFIPIQQDYLKCPLNKVIRSHRAWPARCSHARTHTRTLRLASRSCGERLQK